MNHTVIYCLDTVFILFLLGVFVALILRYLRYPEKSGMIPAQFQPATFTVVQGQYNLQPVPPNGIIELCAPRMTIGSDPSNQPNHYVVTGNGVASKHGEIVWAKGRWWYVGKGGAGTVIRYGHPQQEKTLQKARHELKHLDEIVVGPVCLRFDNL